LYRQLFALKNTNTALWNGSFGAPMEQVVNSAPKQVFSFMRQNTKDKVFAVFNLSAKPVQVTFPDTLQRGRYRELGSGAMVEYGEAGSLQLAPWAYKVYLRP
jgi:hypothetical protein